MTAASLATVPLPSHVPSVADPAGYIHHVYDPRYDPRNEYPKIAQEILFDPNKFGQLQERAKLIVSAGIYGYGRNPERDIATVTVVALKGFSMGLDFARALETVKVIHGQPTIRGPRALDLIRERTIGATLECTVSTETECVWLLGRPGADPKKFSGTMDGVHHTIREKNLLWGVYPKRMLKWSVFSEGAQELFGDVLTGCYIEESMHPEPEAAEPPAVRQATNPLRTPLVAPEPVDASEGEVLEKEHPKRVRVTDLLNALSEKQSSTLGIPAGKAKSAIYSDLCHRLMGKEDPRITESMCDKFIAHLEPLVSSDEPDSSPQEEA